MANEFTLADYELTATPLTRKTVRTWREASPILDMFKFKTSKNLTEEIIRFNTVGTPVWRDIGEAFTQSKVTPVPLKERLHFMGGQIDVPVEYVKAESIIDNREAQEEAAMKGMAFGFNEAFFTNTPTANRKAVVGLWYRIKNYFAADQAFAAGIDVSEDTGLTDWVGRTHDVIGKLLRRVEGNDSEKVLFMGKTLYERVQSACRRSQLLDTTTDQLGRMFLTYGKGGAKIVEAGTKYDQSTEILGDAENALTALTGGSHSSMYCVRFGEPYVAGWCQDMPSAVDKGEIEAGTHYRTIVKFSPGLYISHARSLAVAHSWTAA